MADTDLSGDAWVVRPSDYIRGRKPGYRPSPPKSIYLTMKDGCRLAIDLYLPNWSPEEGPWPTILVQTPYYRRFAVDPSAGQVEAAPNIAKYRDAFVPRGYALVVVDVRGTGASFGTRDIFRSPKERDDAYQIAEWIVAQKWSNGSIGATGISYLGAASDFLASTSHPAVKAIAPLFSVWDTYLDNYYPGGILLNNLADVYDRMMAGLDHDKRQYLKDFVYYANPAYRGPHPVDDDADGSDCATAVKEHAGNFRMPELMRKLEYRSDPLEDSNYSSDSISPSQYFEGVREDVAIYSVSGWMDGAGYANGAISRFLTLPNERKFLLLGPWDHGARINCSLWRANEAPEFDIYAEVLRFFDEYLAGRQTGIEFERSVHYFSVHEEKWRAADAWPPYEANKTLFLTQESGLAHAAGSAGSDGHDINFDSGTGQFTRHERIAAIDSREYYTDWHGRDRRMLNYTSAELDQDAELTGHCLISLWMISPAPDFAIHAYLSEILPSGETLYVTEGSLRAIHRSEVEPPRKYRTPAVFHPCTRGHAKDVTPGQPHLFRFSLLPISWTFLANSRIRFSLEGADADHFQRIPASGPLRVEVMRGGGNASHIMLPLRTT
jgi:putative CocE/NonD family hydrolase